MPRYLLAGTAVLALAAPATAETISNAITQPVRTSTIKNGSADAITIAATGSVKPTGGTAVTMDSDHAVTIQGTIGIANANGAIGLLATAGTSGAITNAGTIAIDETYTPADADNDGDFDGPFATGSNRFGIRTGGAHAGHLVHSGTITVEGNESAGIWLGGPLSGNLTHGGTTTVVGDRSVAVHAGAVNGAVRLAGQVSAQGEDAIAARFAGDVTGPMVIQGSVTSTGYRSTTAPSSTAGLDADDLLQGGPAVVVEGNVAGGIRFAVAPRDTNAEDKDEDKDGIEDAKEGSAAVTSFGAAPAVAIGAADRDIVIGPAGAATMHGLVIEGSIAGRGVYAGIEATGLAIGGRGGTVTIANGLAVSGSLEASSNGASATALRLGSGAELAEVRNSGTISASGGNAASANTTAILVDVGATVPAIRNSASIKATAAGAEGSATAILDRSGTLSLIENSGAISASGAAAVRNVAIDLSANSAGATVRQITGAAPGIIGKVLFGSGNDVLEIGAGSLVGDVSFGVGNNQYILSGGSAHTGKVIFGGGSDTLSLAGSARFVGEADFGGGAGTLMLAGTSAFAGAIVNSAGVAVTVNGGALLATNHTSIASLAVGASGTLVAILDTAPAAGSFYTVAGAATFADGATIALTLGEIDNAIGRHTILEAQSVTGLAKLKTNAALLPVLFKATVANDAPANTVAVDVTRKSAQELELSRSQASAYDAIFSALGKDEEIEDVFLGIRDADLLRTSLGQMLPDHAGGAFEGVSRGVRAFARQVADPQSPVYTLGGIDLIVSAAGWSSSKDAGQTAGYDLGGFGVSGTGEIDTGLGSFGLSATYYWNDYDQGSLAADVESSTLELAAYWRHQWGGLGLYGRGSYGLAGFEGRRTFAGSANGEAVSKRVRGEWDGTLVTASAGAAYELRSGAAFLRPSVSLDYLKLDEDGYRENGGGEALDLTVEARSSDELAGNAGVSVGLDFRGRGGDRAWLGTGPVNRWFRVEAEGGWREVLAGSIGATTARFDGGTPFTLAADQAESGWYTRLRAMGGGPVFELGGEVAAERRNGDTALSMRGSVRIGF